MLRPPDRNTDEYVQGGVRSQGGTAFMMEGTPHGEEGEEEDSHGQPLHSPRWEAMVAPPGHHQGEKEVCLDMHWEDNWADCM